MNYRLILRLQSVIVASIALAFLSCYGVSLFPSPIADEAVAGAAFIECTIVAIILAIILFFFSRGAQVRLFRKEALATIGLGWLTASAVGAMPYVLIADLTPIEAFFETASGLTTTGASVLSDIEALPHSLLFWRALSQWIGGMGVSCSSWPSSGFSGPGPRRSTRRKPRVRPRTFTNRESSRRSCGSGWFTSRSRSAAPSPTGSAG